MGKLYIDTNIFLNVINNEVSAQSGRNMSEPAAHLFFQAISCKHHLLISTWTLREAYKKIDVEQMRLLLELCKKKTIIIQHTLDDITVAKSRCHQHWHDALHIILAEKNDADSIITRNKDDFLMIGSKILVQKPEQLL